ncbi:hypothetical protein PMIN01_12639 [Paraphaeosphaeria minitans]|uniref:Uncharacterized protein n=1 Tax=Paraphaeosphaeria minitans TaxID=565426 RepID=A0A9P6KK05_9PLEO|nr:hypothetical protein PMIN01_12639 [Paraphaeosphaeria minitans]
MAFSTRTRWLSPPFGAGYAVKPLNSRRSIRHGQPRLDSLSTAASFLRNAPRTSWARRNVHPACPEA